MTDREAIAEFTRLYQEASGKPTTNVVDAMRELFSAYSQARVFASELNGMFTAERKRTEELEEALFALKRSHIEIERSERRFRALVSNASDVVIVIDADDRVTYASDAVERICGCSGAELSGRQIADYVHPDDAAKLTLAFRSAREDSGRPLTVNFRVVQDDHAPRYIEAALTDLSDEPTVCGIVFNGRDVTDRVQLEEELRHAAYRDPLTGLPNRALFNNHLENVWPDDPQDEPSIGLLLIDIDRFKLINDTRGHPAGDQVLVEVAGLLRESAPHGSIVGRLGGDEFAMLVRISDGIEPERVAAELVAKFVDEAGDIPSVSVGVAFPGDGCATPADLVRAADAALYQAKQDGRRRHSVFNPEQNDAWLERRELEVDLESATREGQLRLLYQPIVEMTNARPIAAEALARWEHPTRGTISPSVFVPLAEESGLIVEIGSWVLRTAIEQLAAWDRSFGESGLARLDYLSVNVSAAELRDPAYPERVSRLLQDAELKPDRIQLELTETLLAEDGHDIIRRLEELKSLGLRLAIDDFGTGYSSLSYLTRMPVDLMKVDRSFVTDMLTSERVESVVRATISLATALDLKVVAEGVETIEQQQKLQALGGELGQGYLYAHPLPADELEALFARGPSIGHAAA